jgi:hypothetical protein
VKKGYLIVLSLMLIPLWTVVAYAIDPNLKGYWPLDESSGIIAHDLAGNHNGVLYGACWTADGRFGGAVFLNGDSNFINIGNLGITQDWTVTCWAKLNQNMGNVYYPIGLSIPYAGIRMGGINNTIRQHIALFYITNGLSLKTNTTVQPGVWYHIALIKKGAIYAIYVNGILENSCYAKIPDIGLNNFKIGVRPDFAGWFKGTVDEVGVWDRALEIGDISDPNPGTINYIRINGISELPFGIAQNPSVLNGQTNVAINKILSWRPGDYAADVNGHDVYFGTNFAEVKSGCSRLVSDLNGDGKVNFTELRMLCEQWLEYIETLEPQADLNGDEAVNFIDFNIMADEWLNNTVVYEGKQSSNSYDPCALEFDTTYYWRIDEVNDSNVWSGNIWQFTTESGSASEPVPADYTAFYNTNIELKWRPGVKASDVNGHDVYIGTDYIAVKDGDASCYKGRQDSNSYTLTDLNYITIYYWRIDEINSNDIWTGNVWRFATKYEGSLATLVNAPTALTIPTYDGSGQAMHPSVVYFPDGWNGYKYWMAMTPLPYSHQDYENPSIVASNDNLSWDVPPGLTNPLIFKPPSWGSYNADPELVYNDDTNELWLYFLRYWNDIGQNKLGLMKSSDGVNWTEPEYLLTWGKFPYNEASFAIIKQGNEWHYWAENGDVDQGVVYRYSTDGENWSSPTTVTFSPVPSSLPWHLDVIYVPTKFEYLMLFSTPGGSMGSSLFFAKSTDRIHWNFYTTEVLVPSGGGWDNGQLYRPTILYDSERQMLRIWYSASDCFCKWGTGYTEIEY